QVSEKIEDAIVSVSGIKQVFSYSRDSSSSVVVLFELDVDLDEATNQVREQVGAIRHELPLSVEAPSVTRMNINAAPVLTYTLSGALGPRELRYYADEIVGPAIEQVKGVADARVRGGAERQINVLVDLEGLQSRGL